MGADGVLAIETSNSLETTVDVQEGMEIDRGYISPQFVNNSERLLVEYDNALVLVTDMKIENVKDIIPLLEQVGAGGRAGPRAHGAGIMPVGAIAQWGFAGPRPLLWHAG